MDGKEKKNVIYITGDIFTQAGQDFLNTIQTNLKLFLYTEGLSEDYIVYNPASNSDINNKHQFSSNESILMGKQAYLDRSVAIIAAMDVDDTGTAFELGYAWANNIPIYQIYTDIRLLGNDNEGKIEALRNDAHQNNFLYKNQLVTGSSYADKNGNDIEQPRIFGTAHATSEAVVGDLVEGLEFDYLNEKDEYNSYINEIQSWIEEELETSYNEYINHTMSLLTGSDTSEGMSKNTSVFANTLLNWSRNLETLDRMRLLENRYRKSKNE